MRILFITPYVPSSVRTRPYAFIRGLARLGHSVTLVCLVQPAWEESYLTEITPYCEAIYPVHLHPVQPYFNVFKSFFSRVPPSVAYCLSRELKQLIIKLISHQSFDLIHTEFVRAAPSTIDLRGMPKVFDAVDSLTLTYQRSLTAPHISLKQRLLSFAEWHKMRNYEPWVLEHFDRTLVSSPIDRQTLQSNQAQVDVVPNGVDLDYFKFYDGAYQASTIVFLGKMSYYVNVASILWFCKNVFPLVRRQHSGVILKIVGRNPVPVISQLAKDPSIEVTGTVPDVRPYLMQANLSVLPMVSGGGMQFKMLESMAIGTPCVATSLACLPLQTVKGRDVLVADTPKEFAEVVCRLMECPEQRHELAENGRQYVERYHDWPKLVGSLNQIFEQVV